MGFVDQAQAGKVSHQQGGQLDVAHHHPRRGRQVAKMGLEAPEEDAVGTYLVAQQGNLAADGDRLHPCGRLPLGEHGSVARRMVELDLHPLARQLGQGVGDLDAARPGQRQRFRKKIMKFHRSPLRLSLGPVAGA